MESWIDKCWIIHLRELFFFKMTKHGEACRRAALAFNKDTGGLGEELAEKQIKRLGEVLARHTGQEEAEKTRNLF